MTIDKRFI